MSLRCDSAETKVYARFPVIDDLRSEGRFEAIELFFLSLSLSKKREVVNRKKIYTSTATFQTVS